MHAILNKTILSVLIGYMGAASAFTFESESISGSFDSTISAGLGVRAQSPSCGLVLRDSSALIGGPIFSGNPGPTGSGAPAACTEVLSGLGDQGNINYKNGDAFTTYLKGSHELLLKMPGDWKFMGRISWLRDFTATHTTGYLSAGNPTTTSQPSDARDDLAFKARLLDFWVSKEFSVGDQRARVRVGNQVVSWGESLFIPGGINQTNSMDFMRLSQPGTQLKEVFLPAPIVSFATGLGGGLNVEAYVQAKSDQSYLPPTGSYWSIGNGVGKGHNDYGIGEKHAKNGGQYGAAVRWQPNGTQLNLGVYAMSYHDKTPNFTYGASGSDLAWVYLEDRKMYGVSANFPIGDWAIGTELSYRPKDAVSLNPSSGCLNNNGNCFAAEKKYQWHLTGLLSMTPGDYGTILNLLGGAQTATLMAEAVAIRYPNLQRAYNGDPIGAMAMNWGFQNDLTTASPQDVGTKTSWGYNLDFSWTYDGTLIPGWQVIPEIYYFQAVKGRTPNFMGTFLEGAKSANVIVSFIQNPATWQFGVNYAKFWGGKDVIDQPLRDRDFFGAYVSRNF